jgi:hypothetical protein
MFAKKHVEYGQDAPFLLRKYLLAGGLSASVGGFLICWSHQRADRPFSLLERSGRGLLETPS